MVLLASHTTSVGAGVSVSEFNLSACRELWSSSDLDLSSQTRQARKEPFYAVDKLEKGPTFILWRSKEPFSEAWAFFSSFCASEWWDGWRSELNGGFGEDFSGEKFRIHFVGEPCVVVVVVRGVAEEGKNWKLSNCSRGEKRVEILREKSRVELSGGERKRERHRQQCSA